ncbi:MAG TPA: hypothetical protein VLL98_01880 [Rickettsiales bacterium]|nr:hypothetical protein [Rickettsiales bacterium]
MKQNTKKDFSIIELFIIIITCSFILAFVIHVEISKNRNEINNLILNIKSYKNAINDFDKKYGFLPGDLKKTQVFDLSVNNTDGNENGLIEDENQKTGDYYSNVYLNGEVLNFWLHLYKSGFVNKTSKIFPYIDFLRSGIIVFTDGENNYFHLSVSGVDKDNRIKAKNNLTPNQAYIIDRKIDDGLPIDGNVFIIGGSFLNPQNMKIAYKNCATEYEYLTVFKKKLCQIVIKL